MSAINQYELKIQRNIINRIYNQLPSNFIYQTNRVTIIDIS